MINANAYVVINGMTNMRGGNANSNFHTRFNGSANDRDAITSSSWVEMKLELYLMRIRLPMQTLMVWCASTAADNDRDALLFNSGGSEFITEYYI